MKIRTGLDEAQKAAVTVPIDDVETIVVAGPGSGKTRVIEHRVRYLVDNGVSPNNVLVVTFSNQGVRELEKRFHLRVDIMTIHSLGKRILNDYVKDTRILAKTWQVRDIIHHVTGNLSEWAANYYWYRMVRQLPMLAEEAQLDWIRSELLRRGVDKLRSNELASTLVNTVGVIELELKDKGLMTYADMIYDSYAALGDKVILNSIKKRWSHILVDEGQDTLRVATAMLKTICKGIYIVGDPDQLIFRFAGADPEYALGITRPEKDRRVIKLERNYRSAPDLVSLSEELIENNYNETNKHLRKSMRAERKGAATIVLSEYKTDFQEATGVAKSCKKIVDESNDTVFVSYRLNAQAALIENALSVLGVSYTVYGQERFVDRKHVKDMIAYIRFLNDPNDDEAFERIYNMPSTDIRFKGEYRPTRMLGMKFLEQCRLTRDSKTGISLYAAMSLGQKKSSGYADLSGLVSRYKVLKKRVNNKRNEAVATLSFIWNEVFSLYFSYTRASPDITQSEVQDWKVLLEMAKAYWVTVEEMLKGLSNMEKDERSSRVVLSTMHKLKSREADIVYGLNISENVIPHASALGYLPLQKNPGDIPVYDPSTVEDERCLMYVLVTRARREVHLSFVNKSHASDTKAGRSRFLDEVGL